MHAYCIMFGMEGYLPWASQVHSMVNDKCIMPWDTAGELGLDDGCQISFVRLEQKVLEQKVTEPMLKHTVPQVVGEEDEEGDCAQS